MKKTLLNKLRPILFGISMLTLAISCEKAEDGLPGKNGNANIQSRTFSITSWGYDAPYHFANLSVPELTAENSNSAGVMVYFTTMGNGWIALPYTQYDSPFNYHMGFLTGVGIVQITWFYDTSSSSGNNPTIYYGKAIQFKVVVIPPAAKILKPDVDYTNYLEVKEAFGLKD